ncbi:hypothetical protein SH449x_004599 [Pirellulaceae bacterium SH449]
MTQQSLSPAATASPAVGPNWELDIPSPSYVPPSNFVSYAGATTPEHSAYGQRSASHDYLQNAYQEQYERPSRSESYFDGTVIGGIVTMVVALVWFFGGLAAGYIFFYPPIMFILGLIAVIKGLLD